jgi:hypothetical protein
LPEGAEPGGHAYGKLYIANPDLPERFARRGHLNAPDRATFYGGGARGYTDYPPLDRVTDPDEELVAQPSLARV